MPRILPRFQMKSRRRIQRIPIMDYRYGILQMRCTRVDWQDAVYRTGVTQNYTIGIRGGSDKVQTAMSFGYYDQKGIVIGFLLQKI